MEEESVYLSPEEADIEPLFMVRARESWVEAVSGLIQQSIDATADEEERNLFANQLEVIANLSEAEQTQYVKDYLDGLKTHDGQLYRLSVDVHRQESLLDRLIGREQATQLRQAFNQEEEVVMARWRKKAAGIKEGLFVPAGAIFGEAIANLAKNPRFVDLPTASFGQLYSVCFAAQNLFDYCQKK